MAQQKIQQWVSDLTGIPLDTTPPCSDTPVFILPIRYLPADQLHALSEVVTSDLELVTTKGGGTTKSMYDVLFQPTTSFGRDMMPEWGKQYTSNTEYLLDTQAVIQETVVKGPLGPLDEQSILEVWKEAKGSTSEAFLEKYCFVEWDILKFLNKSPAFLQMLSIANVMSPAVSLVMPLLFLLFPFLILKLRGIPITFSVYRDVLQDIARNHFIGKALTNITSLSLDKLAYFCIMTGLYGWQIYQNVLVCQRFYRNVFRINQHLLDLRAYVDATLEDMADVVSKHQTKPSYRDFCREVRRHAILLEGMREDLCDVTPMTSFAQKLLSVGYLLQRYYELHVNPDYHRALRYSFGFHGWLDNLRGVKAHVDAGTIQLATFSKATQFEGQVYPPIANVGVRNPCSLAKNVVLTGPNASGKTTFLKTTSINIIFCQQVGAGFFQSGRVKPYTHIHSYLNIPDTSERDSLFQAESRRCKEILTAIESAGPGARHFCIFDEIYSGTNPDEATKSGYAFMNYLTRFDHVDFILTTHYVKMCKRLRKNKRVLNYQMEVEENREKLTYTYKMKRGISQVQGAVRILEDMDYPKEILDAIRSA